MIQSSEPLQSGLIISGQHKQPASRPRSPPGPAGGLGVTAVAERVAVGAAAMAHQHRGRLAEPQLIGDAARAQVGAITEPAVAASAAAAELVHSGRQRQRLRFRGRRWGFRHHRSAFLSNRGPDTAAGAVSAESSPTRRDAGRGQQSAGTERVGFEPTDPCGSPVFKTGAINHSTTSPRAAWAWHRAATPCSHVPVDGGPGGGRGQSFLPRSAAQRSVGGGDSS